MSGSFTDPALRGEAFRRFHALTAGELMRREVDPERLLPLHTPLDRALAVLRRHSHAWLLEDPERGALTPVNILHRRDLLFAARPLEGSYSRIQTGRFKGIEHGGADCACRLVEGRAFHVVGPSASCAEILHLMTARNVTVLPVVADGLLLGEVGGRELLDALAAALELT